MKKNSHLLALLGIGLTFVLGSCSNISSITKLNDPFFTVTFVDQNGFLLHNTEVAHGEVIDSSDLDTALTLLEPTIAEGWEFARWDIIVSSPIVEDTVIAPVLNILTFEVTFMDSDYETELAIVSVPFGMDAAWPDWSTSIEPTLTVLGWLGEWRNVRKDAVVFPIIEEVSTYDIDGIIYVPYHDGIMLVKDTVGYYDELLELPDTVFGFNVVAIAPRAFLGSVLERSIQFPSSLISIGEHAFAGASVGKPGIVFPETIVEIDQYAFQDIDSNINAEFPSSLRHIGAHCFSGPTIGSGARIHSLAFNDGLEYIGGGAFANVVMADLENDLVIPKTLKYMGENVFLQAQTLMDLPINVVFEEGTETIFASCFREAGWINIASIVIPASVVTIEYAAFQGGSSRLTELTFLGGTDSKLETIGAQAFTGVAAGIAVASSFSVTLPRNLKTVGSLAFYLYSPTLTSATRIINISGIQNNSLSVQLNNSATRDNVFGVGWSPTPTLSAWQIISL